MTEGIDYKQRYLQPGAEVFYKPGKQWGEIKEVIDGPLGNGDGYYILHLAPFKIVKAYKSQITAKEQPKHLRTFRIRQGWTRTQQKTLIIYDMRHKKRAILPWDWELEHQYSTPDGLQVQAFEYFNSCNIDLVGYCWPSDNGDLLIMSDNFDRMILTAKELFNSNGERMAK